MGRMRTAGVVFALGWRSPRRAGGAPRGHKNHGARGRHHGWGPEEVVWERKLDRPTAARPAPPKVMTAISSSRAAGSRELPSESGSRRRRPQSGITSGGGSACGSRTCSRRLLPQLGKDARTRVVAEGYRRRLRGRCRERMTAPCAGAGRRARNTSRTPTGSPDLERDERPLTSPDLRNGHRRDALQRDPWRRGACRCPLEANHVHWGGWRSTRTTACSPVRVPGDRQTGLTRPARSCFVGAERARGPMTHHRAPRLRANLWSDDRRTVRVRLRRGAHAVDDDGAHRDAPRRGLRAARRDARTLSPRATDEATGPGLRIARYAVRWGTLRSQQVALATRDAASRSAVNGWCFRGGTLRIGGRSPREKAEQVAGQLPDGYTRYLCCLRSVTRDGGAGEGGRSLRFDSAAETVASSARSPRRLIGARLRPRLPAALSIFKVFGTARVQHRLGRHAASKQAMGPSSRHVPRRDDVTKVATRMWTISGAA